MITASWYGLGGHRRSLQFDKADVRGRCVQTDLRERPAPLRKRGLFHVVVEQGPAKVPDSR